MLVVLKFAVHLPAVHPGPTKPRWFHWAGRLSSPASKPSCGGCGQAVPAGARYCPRCGRAWFGVGTAEEVELPAGRTATLAAGALLARYEPESAAARWRDGNGDERGPVLIVRPQGERESVLVLRVLSPAGVGTRWGPGYEVTALEVEPESVRVEVRRVR